MIVLYIYLSFIFPFMVIFAIIDLRRKKEEDVALTQDEIFISSVVGMTCGIFWPLVFIFPFVYQIAEYAVKSKGSKK